MQAIQGSKQPFLNSLMNSGVLVEPLPGTALASELRAGPLTLRRFRAEDSQSLFNAVQESVDDLCSWMVWCRPDYTLQDAEAFVQRCAADWATALQFSYAITDSRDGAFLGSVGLNSVNLAHRFANVGYWVRTSQTSRGIASTALQLLSRLALTEGGFERLEILVPVGNVPSQRVAEKARAQQEGVLRNRIMLNGKPHDAWIYSLVKSDLL
jgi:ribosomal-protein-serine acetyltransferase